MRRAHQQAAAQQQPHHSSTIVAQQLQDLHALHAKLGDEAVTNCLHRSWGSPAFLPTVISILGTHSRWPNLTFDETLLVTKFVGMGFPEDESIRVLSSVSGDQGKALEKLKASHPPASRAPASPSGPTPSCATPTTQPAPPRASVPAKLFSQSSYLAAYQRTAPPEQGYELLAKVHRLCCLFAAAKVRDEAADVRSRAAAAADRFFNDLQRQLDSRSGHLADVGTAATRIWSSAVTLRLGPPGDLIGEYEFAQMLNEVLRGDRASALLDCAVVVARAINRHCVQGTYTGWPDGPLGIGNRQSDKKDTTFRGGALRRDLIDWFAPGKKYRTNMFVASSFRRAAAEKFECRAGASVDKDPVRWVFKFEHERCLHVNFLRPGAESTCTNELEFLLTPGSVLVVESVQRSSSLHDAPHEIRVRVSPDNALEPLDLPVAPWC